MLITQRVLQLVCLQTHERATELPAETWLAYSSSVAIFGFLKAHLLQRLSSKVWEENAGIALMTLSDVIIGRDTAETRSHKP